MRIKVLFVGLFLALLLPAHADIMQINATSAFWGNEWVSPYHAQIYDGTNWGPAFWVACLDINLTTYAGQPYTYTVTQNSPTDNKYKAAAVLTQQAVAGYNAWAASPTAANLNALGITSFAIWDLFDDANVQGKLTTTDLGYVRNLASTTLSAVANNTVVVPNYLVYTPTVDSQKFIRVVPDGGVTLVLLGGALVGLETVRRRLRA